MAIVISQRAVRNVRSMIVSGLPTTSARPTYKPELRERFFARVGQLDGAHQGGKGLLVVRCVVDLHGGIASPHTSLPAPSRGTSRLMVTTAESLLQHDRADRTTPFSVFRCVWLATMSRPAA